MSHAGKITYEKIIELYQGGMTVEEIANRYGYKNGDYIRAKLRDAGVWRIEHLDTGKVMALHRAKWSVRDIAFDMGATEEQIRDAIANAYRG